MTLNRMYHCVPRIISGRQPDVGVEPEGTMPTTATETAGWRGTPPGTAPPAARLRPQRAAVRSRRRPAPRSRLRARSERARAHREQAEHAAAPSIGQPSSVRRSNDLPQRQAARPAPRCHSQSPTATQAALGDRDGPCGRGAKQCSRSDSRLARDATATTASAAGCGADVENPGAAGACAPVGSKRNLSAQATRGRNSSWS